MEWVDVINKEGEVIEKASREEVHKKRLLHKAVRIFVFNAKKQLYVQKRSSDKEIYPSYFEGSLSGHVSSGENYAEAAKRELKEELNISGKPKELFKYELYNTEEQAIFKLFIIENYDGEITLDREEVESGKFMNVEDIEKEISEGKKYTPGFVKCIGLYLQK